MHKSFEFTANLIHYSLRDICRYLLYQIKKHKIDICIVHSENIWKRKMHYL